MSRAEDLAREAALQERRSALRAAWMERHGLDFLPRRDRALWSPVDRFWRRALGLPSWSRKALTACHAIHGDLPHDHVEVFQRGGVEVASVSNFYFDWKGVEAYRAEVEAAWRAVAEKHGLRFEMSEADSWHYPSRTTLFVLWIPDGGSR